MKYENTFYTSKTGISFNVLSISDMIPVIYLAVYEFVRFLEIVNLVAKIVLRDDETFIS